MVSSLLYTGYGLVFLQAQHEVKSDTAKHFISDLKTGKKTLEEQLNKLNKEKEEALIRIGDLEATVQSCQVQSQEHSEELIIKLRQAEEAFQVCKCHRLIIFLIESLLPIRILILKLIKVEKLDIKQF